jgi:Protein of unknown function (DUF3768)
MDRRKTKTRRRRTNAGAKPLPKVTERVVPTKGIKALPPADQFAILERIERFTGSKLANRKRAFGAFTLNGKKVFWTVDDSPNSSEDPYDPERPLKIICVMLADEC